MNILQNVLPEVTSPKSDDRIRFLPVCHILKNPANPRKYFDSAATLRLADSIRRHGILEPLCVRRPGKDCPADGYDGLYELISGERRLRAAKLLGMTEVPCIIMEADGLHSAELAIIEDLQRENLNLFEEASAISALIGLYGLTQTEVAAKLSVSQSYIANKLRLLRFDEGEREAILAGGLSERHARALLRLADGNTRRAALETVLRRAYTVAETEDYVAGLCTDDLTEEKPRRAAVRDIRLFYNTVDRAVGILRRAGVDAAADKRELADLYEVTVRIPKCTE